MRLMALGLAVVIASGFGITDSRAQQPAVDGATQGPPPIRELPPLNLPPTSPVGSAAITPRINAIPAFTLDDAKEYVAAHSLPLHVARDIKPTVTRIEFLTSQQVSALLHGVTTGFAANHLLCYVELQGPFSFAGPRGAIATYNRGVLIFDAQTGNLVIRGGLPS
jgi:hypothetical protein